MASNGLLEYFSLNMNSPNCMQAAERGSILKLGMRFYPLPGYTA